MVLELPFITLDVFKTQRYAGNPLAVVTIPSDLSLQPTQDQKQLIARKFNLSETVFVHDATGSDTRNIDTFLADAEAPLAGYPTIGTGTAADLLPQNVQTLGHQGRPHPGHVQASIPHSTRLHARRHARRLTPDLVARWRLSRRACPLRPPVRSAPLPGMASVLVELPSLDNTLRAASASSVHLPPDQILDQGW
ncbi:LOW QUALITY PROTEIN: putative epimerase YddE/YHI9, PhzF superfamily [Geosmithia morbida]|uniref:Epimerase YddE/YHI9, PhzF superfamily n=1 Tax=Geosmithia morbida TaxID=1094350 RepID=A0A9P4YT80_9HYPO|nr:LOW QUALITY PROTEIN: putative epimerase YddE/YHI9, PhzF superfamily [Geosmithia morbida]KAF4122678.1 LOW QUALITY PROTEIN: putative epimerase YddE/YHI9, PhzF superfamily [Geosmithia morbida]